MKFVPAKFVELAVCAGILLSGCQSTGGVLERLDTTSGLTIVTEPAAAVFARTQGQFSRSARDYLYLGPVEVNERGLREHYWWVGLASTIDRDYLAANAATPSRLVIEVDGVPVEFELVPWDARVPRLAGRSIYDPVVAPAVVLAARLTLDQLALVAGARVDSVRIGADDGSTDEYFLWDEDATWPAFASFAGIR